MEEWMLRPLQPREFSHQRFSAAGGQGIDKVGGGYVVKDSNEDRKSSVLQDAINYAKKHPIRR